MNNNIFDDLKILTDQVERLKIENGLLRAASEEQRELNGQLRVEQQKLERVLDNIHGWIQWYDTWSIFIDGTAYTESYDIYTESSILLEEYDSIHLQRNQESSRRNSNSS